MYSEAHLAVEQLRLKEVRRAELAELVVVVVMVVVVMVVVAAAVKVGKCPN